MTTKYEVLKRRRVNRAKKKARLKHGRRVGSPPG